MTSKQWDETMILILLFLLGIGCAVIALLILGLAIVT